jgi:hypothetical protein
VSEQKKSPDPERRKKQGDVLAGLLAEAERHLGDLLTDYALTVRTSSGSTYQRLKPERVPTCWPATPPGTGAGTGTTPAPRSPTTR